MVCPWLWGTAQPGVDLVKDFSLEAGIRDGASPNLTDQLEKVTPSPCHVLQSWILRLSPCGLVEAGPEEARRSTVLFQLGCYSWGVWEPSSRARKMLGSALDHEGKDPRAHGTGQGSDPCPAYLGPCSAFLRLWSGFCFLVPRSQKAVSVPSASQPAISAVEAYMLVCRLWVGGQDVVGNSLPAPGLGEVFVCVPR